jgi:hypothetical protein
MRLCYALLLLTATFAGCGTTSHGRATSTVAERNQMRYILASGDTINRQRIQESRLRDAEGREWTESKVIAEDPVKGGLSGLEAQLYQSALDQQE